VDHWLYIGGEFAGDTWAIAHRNGDVDELTYRDFRIFGGLECKVVGGLDSHLEVAYVLGRKFQFASNRPDFEPNDTFMLRGGVSY